MDDERKAKLWPLVQNWAMRIEPRPDWIEVGYLSHSVIPYYVPGDWVAVSVKELIDDAEVLSLLTAQGYKVAEVAEIEMTRLHTMRATMQSVAPTHTNTTGG